MKVIIYVEEAYPVYDFSKHAGVHDFCTDVPDELLVQWEKVQEIYEFTQDQMKAAYERCINKS